MFLVGTAIYGYRHGEYWDAVRQSVLLADISHRRFWGRSFLLFLALLGLPFPRCEQRNRDRRARAYVGPILLHAMIPNDCLPDFFETCVEPAVRSSKWAGLSASDLIAEWLGAPRALRAAVGTPVFDFLRNGGCHAEGLVDCAVAMARHRYEKGMLPDCDVPGLPRRIVEAYERWLRTVAVKRFRERIRKPFLRFDPGVGIALELPEQILGGPQRISYGIWSISPARQTRWVPASQTDGGTRIKGHDYPVPPDGPYTVSLKVGEVALGEWKIEGMNPAQSVEGILRKNRAGTGHHGPPTGRKALVRAASLRNPGREQWRDWNLSRDRPLPFDR